MDISAKTRKISLAAGLMMLMLGVTNPANATTAPLIFSDCGSGVSCASFLSNVVGTFNDSYTFNITSTSGFGAAALNIDLTTFANIANFNLGLWQGPTNLANGTIFSFASLPSGSYLLNLTGTTGSLGGFYAGVAMLAPVPEASAWLMMLVGVSLVGLALHRKTNREDLIAA